MLKDHKFKAARASVRGGAREREWKDREKGRTLTGSQIVTFGDEEIAKEEEAAFIPRRRTQNLIRQILTIKILTELRHLLTKLTLTMQILMLRQN
ncbi:hypothetical protein ACET3Z_028702 [Daucus carota]